MSVFFIGHAARFWGQRISVASPLNASECQLRRERVRLVRLVGGDATKGFVKIDGTSSAKTGY